MNGMTGTSCTNYPVSGPAVVVDVWRSRNCFPQNSQALTLVVVTFWGMHRVLRHGCHALCVRKHADECGDACVKN